MVTQRSRKQQTRRGASPIRDNEKNYRNDSRRSNSGGNLTSVLVLCLIVAFVLLVVVIYLYNKKGNQPTPIPVNVTEQKPVSTPVAPKVVTPPVVVEEEKVEVVKKKKKKPAVDTNEKANTLEPKKGVDLEVTGSEKKPVKVKPAETETEKVPNQPGEQDEPIIPKSFMGGLSNPEMEKSKVPEKTKEDNKNQDQDRAKEEARKKNRVDLE